jgi:hypothetical protein
MSVLLGYIGISLADDPTASTRWVDFGWTGGFV